MRRAADGASARSTAPSASGYTENSLLAGAALEMKASDLLRLVAPPVVEDGAYQVRLRTAGTRAAALDAARLMLADHAPGSSAYGVGGGVVLGTRVVPARVTTARGTDVTQELDGSGVFAAASGEVLTVSFAPEDAGATPAPLVIEAATGTARGLPDSSGILIQTPDGAGGWLTVHQVYPRRNPDELAVEGVAAGSLRLVCLSGCELRFVGRVSLGAEPPRVQWAALLSARSSRLGDEKLALSSADSLSGAMAGTDTLKLGFAVPPLTDSMRCVPPPAFRREEGTRPHAALWIAPRRSSTRR